MKNNNKGFIAISLIYSFFLIFLVTILSILADYAHNRLLLNDVKKETQNYLDGMAEFNPVHIENKTYSAGETITFGADTWLIAEDTGTEVTLILNRLLTEEEIIPALNEESITGVSVNNTTLMCLNSYTPALCNFTDSVTFNYYSWDRSIVKKIVDYWINNDPILQKAISIGNIQEKTFSDGIKNYTAYIRIPNLTEYSILNDPNVWYITSASNTNGISSINIGGNNVASHSNYKGIRPVIVVKKS